MPKNGEKKDYKNEIHEITNDKNEDYDYIHDEKIVDYRKDGRNKDGKQKMENKNKVNFKISHNATI